MSKVDKLLDRLNGLKSNGHNRWLAKCPAHNDKAPSLAIKLADDDKILLKCWAGCDTQNVLAAVGLEFADLFPEKDGRINYDNTRMYTKAPAVPHFNFREMFPLLMQEALVLAIALNSLGDGEPLFDRQPYYKTELTDVDINRMRQAIQVVINVHLETLK